VITTDKIVRSVPLELKFCADGLTSRPASDKTARHVEQPELWFMADVDGVAGDRLKSFVERIERLEEEKQALSGDIKEVYSEAKGAGFDTKIMRQIIRLRKMDKDEIDEQEALLDTYKRALGMLPDFEKAAE
jgi:uncharacterized protein (UPF0335 family)